MACQFINVKTFDKVRVLRIQRPAAANKLNIGCMDELTAVLREADRDPQCGAVVLTSSGDFFCSGGELGDFRNQTPVDIRAFGASFIALHTTIVGLSKPVIAAVQGDALGGGMNLVEACDLAVAADTACFAVPEIKVGLAPMMGLTGLFRSLPKKRVMELSLFAEKITAAKALEWGFVNRIAAKEEVLNEALAMGRTLSAASPVAVSLCKALYRQIDPADYQKQLETGLNMLVCLLKSADAAEALTAREQNRQPIWEGR